MGFLDSFSSSPIAQDIQNATPAVNSIDQYLSDSGASTPNLVSVGTAALGNLTPAQIEAGLTGAPAQPTVAPTQAQKAADIPAARALTASSTTLALVAAAAAYYFGWL